MIQLMMHRLRLQHVRTVGILAGVAVLAIGATIYAGSIRSVPIEYATGNVATSAPQSSEPTLPPLDREAYRAKLFDLAHASSSAMATSSATSTASTSAQAHTLWPPEPVYPKRGAILPFHRIVAYYGNFYSQRMGILGEYPSDEVIARLEEEVAAWEKADPDTPVMPAIHYIAATAQGTPGPNGMYRFRMPDQHIEKAIRLAERIDGITFLDIQIGQSELMTEATHLREYLREPDVHLAIDPEFAMPPGSAPGERIGFVTAAEINEVTAFLAELVNRYDLPPKVLVIHRFTQNMVQNYDQIKRREEVQIVMDMDGWGPPWQKKRTYRDVVYDEPVQFTGFKVFYENDRKPPSPGLMSPRDILQLKPKPIYIQYQ